MFHKIFSGLAGKYTLKYYESYCKVKKKLPYTEPLKEHFIAHNLDLFIKNSKYPSYHTDVIISYPDIQFKTSFEKISHKYGQPSQFAIYKMLEHTLAIAAFKSLVLNDENKIILYFFDEELIEFEYILFNLKEKEYKNVLYRVIINKYLAGRELSEDEGFYLEDSDKNQVFVLWNGFDLSIKFLSCFSNVYEETFMDYYNNVWKLKKKEPENDDDNNPLFIG